MSRANGKDEDQIGLPIDGAPEGARPEPSDPHEAALEMASGDWDRPKGQPYRRIYCRYYNRCLDHVIELGWQGFTCRACLVVDEIGAVDRVDQDARLLAVAEGMRVRWSAGGPAGDEEQPG